MINNFKNLIQKTFLLLACTMLICSSCRGMEKQEIKASEIIKLVKKEKNVQVVNKIILDDLDFTSINQEFIVTGNLLQNEIRSNIFFSDCIFMGKVTTNSKKSNVPVQTVFDNNLVFTACDFRGNVDLSNAVVFGMCNFSRSVFREEVNMNNLCVWAKDSYFNEIKVEKGFSLIYASFHGNLYMTNSEFSEIFSMQETSIAGKLSLNNSKFNARAGFDLITVDKKAFFNYVTFEKIADFSFSHFMQEAEFVNTTFSNGVLFENVDMKNLKIDNN